MNEENFDQHQILTSTPIRHIPSICDESVAPIAPGFSPMSLTSDELDDDSQRQRDESTITEQPPVSTSQVQPAELMQQMSEEIESDLHPQNQSVKGVKLVGDNIDRTVRPRQQRLNQQTQSLHYFNTMAVQDRIDISNLSDECKTPTELANFDVASLLPTEADLESIQDNFAILLSRKLVKFIPALQALQPAAVTHLNHQYSTEMSQKSTVVSSGLILQFTVVIILLYP